MFKLPIISVHFSATGNNRLKACSY